jgi:hypothetical protein
MNPATLQRPRRPARSAVVPATLAEDLDAFPENVDAAPAYFFLEPGGEGIVFAVACVLCSAIVYAGVLVARLLA